MVRRLDVNILKRAETVWPFVISLALHLLLFSVCGIPRAPKVQECIMVDLAFPRIMESKGPARSSKTSPVKASAAPPSAALPQTAPPAALPPRHTQAAAVSERSVQENATLEKRPVARPDQITNAGGTAPSAPGNGEKSIPSPAPSAARGTSAAAIGADNAGSPSGRAIEGVFGATDGPAFIEKVQPVYPRFARRLGKEGTVLLRLAIDESGTLTTVEIVERAGHGFDEAAVAAVRTSRFKPARHRGVPVPCRALLPVRFKLEG